MNDDPEAHPGDKARQQAGRRIALMGGVATVFIIWMLFALNGVGAG